MAGTVTARLEAAVRAFGSATRTPESLAHAQTEFAEVGAQLMDFATTNAGAMDEMLSSQVYGSGSALRTIGLRGETEYGYSAGSIPQAWFGAALIDTAAARALPSGHAGLDADALLHAYRMPADVGAIDGIGALRITGLSRWLAPRANVFASTLEDAWVVTPNAVIDPDKVQQLSWGTTAMSELAAQPVGVRDMGESALTVAMRTIDTPTETQFTTASMAGVTTNDPELGQALTLTARARTLAHQLDRTMMPRAHGAIAADGLEVNERFAELTSSLAQLEQHPGIARIRAAGLIDATPIAAGMERVLELAATHDGAGALDQLRQPVDAAGGNYTTMLDAFSKRMVLIGNSTRELAAPGRTEHDALVASLRELVTTPVVDAQDAGARLERALRSVADANWPQTGARAREIDRELQRVGYGLAARFRHDDVLEPGTVDRLQVLLVDVRANRPVTEVTREPVRLSASLTREAASMLLADRSDFVATRQDFQSISAQPDLAAARATATGAIDRLPDDWRRSDLLETLPTQVRQLQVQLRSAGAIPLRDESERLVNEAARHVPRGVEMTWGGGPLLTEHVPGTATEIFDRAVQADTATFERRAARLRDLGPRAGGATPTTRAQSGLRQAIGTVDGYDGEAHTAPGHDRLPKELGGVARELTTIDGELQAYAPHLDEDVYGELARSMLADENAATHSGQVTYESLWPDRAKFGRASVDLDLLAALETESAAAPSAI